MDQGTQEWLEWRHAGIGASDSAAIFGVSQYLTKRELWLEKIGPCPDRQYGGFASEKGGVAETHIRAKYNLEHSCNCEPRQAEHDTFHFIKASLDGFCTDTARAIEVKFVGKDAYATEPKKIEKGQAHWIQCQHQMLASGLFYIDYCFSADRNTFKQKRIFLDSDFQDKLLLELPAFWHLVTTRTDPGYSEDDAKPVEDAMLKALLDVYPATKGKDREMSRARIKELVTWPRMEYQGVTVTLTAQGKLTIR